jgi:hypothetical protein
MVFAYLSRLSEVAQGSLPTLERARLVEQIRRCIDAQRQPGARDDADRVERILDRMGEPDRVVGEAVRRLSPDEPDTADLPFRVTGPVAPDADPLVAAISPLAEAEPDLLSRLSRRRREVFALLALTLGTVLLSHAGLILGGVLVGTSKLWVARDKLITLFALPLVALFGGIVLTWLQATRLDPAAATGERLEHAGEWLWGMFLALPIVVGWSAGLYLGYRLLRPTD